MSVPPVPDPILPRLSRCVVVVILATLPLLFLAWFLSPRVFTPYDRLMTAIEVGNVSAVKAVLDRGTDVNGLPDSQEEENVSPLGAAAEDGKIEIVRLLLDRGADVNMSDSGETPLTAAAETDRVDVVELLIARGAKVNEDEQSSYALWRAAVEGKVAVVRVLLAHGANPNTSYFTDNKKESLLQVVKEFQHPDVAVLLKQAGAKEQEPEPRRAESGTIKNVSNLIQGR